MIVAAMAMGWILRGIPHQCIRKAETAIESWQFEEAKRHLRDYPSWGTDAGRVFFLRARVDRHQAGYARAMQHLRAAQEAGFDPTAIAREQAFMIIQNGGLSPALIGQLDDFLQQAPEDHPAVYEVFANAQFQAGNSTGALELLDRWSEEHHHDGRPFYWKGWMLQQQGDNDLALAMYTESTKRNPAFVDSYVAQATIWSNRSVHNQVEKAYRQACEIAPHRLDTRIALGKTLWKMQRKSETVELLKPIADQHPTVYPCGRMVAQYYTEQNDPAKVIATLRPMMQNFPDDASLNYMLASAYNEAGKRVESRAAMEKFLIANENIDRLRSSSFDAPLAEQYKEALRRALAYRRYDWEQSIKWLNLAAEGQPDNPEPHALLARHYRELGSNGDAVQQQNIAETLAQRH
jgi:tetratricopeptide (TPR) repeat protein